MCDTVELVLTASQSMATVMYLLPASTRVYSGHYLCIIQRPSTRLPRLQLLEVYLDMTNIINKC